MDWYKEPDIAAGSFMLSGSKAPGWSKFEKYLLDTHDHPVLDPVWKMYGHALKMIGTTATLLEWDDRIPSFDEVHNEALKSNNFREQQLVKTTAEN